MGDVNCSGEEKSLLDCEYVSNDNCHSSEGAGAVCSRPVLQRSKCRVSVRFSQLFYLIKANYIWELLFKYIRLVNSS